MAAKYDENYPAIYLGETLGWVRPTKTQIDVCNKLFLKGGKTPFSQFENCLYDGVKVRIRNFRWLAGQAREYLISSPNQQSFWVGESELVPIK